jgi:hypothetical protein
MLGLPTPKLYPSDEADKETEMVKVDPEAGKAEVAEIPGEADV